MKLDRALIKSQAKQLISGRVLVLFVITFVVTLLTNGAYQIYTINRNVQQFNKNGIIEQFSSQTPNLRNYGELEDYLDDFEDYIEENESSEKLVTKSAISSYLSRLAIIVNIIFSPLSILLCGVYLFLIRGNALGLYDEFSYVFKNCFDKNYFNKLLLVVLKSIFTLLWSLLFIIPGIVYSYSVYFAEFIQADYPELTWKDCLSLSKKLTRNHKGELFVFDLSFILWIFLSVITLGIASIYVNPYVMTAKALYYENFKQRALATGEITQTDFMTEAQKYAQFVSNNPVPTNGGYYRPMPHAPLNNYGTQPQQSAAQYINYPPQSPAPAPEYYHPTPPQAPAAPQDAEPVSENTDETL